jgi:zinc protease
VSVGGRLAGLAVVAGLAVSVGAGGCATFRSPEPGTPEAAADSLLNRKGPPVGLRVVERLRFQPLEFDPPSPARFKLSNGVTVFFLQDETLPVVDVFIDYKGGYVYFDREHYGAAAALLPLMRNGGTRSFTPDSVDAIIEFNALGLSTSTDGGRMVLGVSSLRRQLDLAIGLWGEILLHPRFDSAAVDRWRVREVESVRRMGDFPGSLAVLEFNHLMFGDHPTGWIMAESDLSREQVRPERLSWLHRRVVCPETAVIGAAGDVSRDELRAALERALADWEPCGTELEAPKLPRLARDPQVYVIPKALSQSTIVIGQPGGVLLGESDEYFASRIANWVIGGSGFTSRLVSRLRTEEGLAYTAATIWGAARDHERIFGAITHTKGESTVDAAKTILATLGEALDDPPDREEVELARESIANGFVFGFSSPAQVVARQVSYLAEGFPADWLSRYLRGIRGVTHDDVATVLRRRIDPAAFTVLIVGDTSMFDPGLLGPVTILGQR